MSEFEEITLPEFVMNVLPDIREVLSQDDPAWLRQRVTYLGKCIEEVDTALRALDATWKLNQMGMNTYLRRRRQMVAKRFEIEGELKLRKIALRDHKDREKTLSQTRKDDRQANHARLCDDVRGELGTTGWALEEVVAAACAARQTVSDCRQALRDHGLRFDALNVELKARGLAEISREEG